MDACCGNLEDIGNDECKTPEEDCSTNCPFERVEKAMSMLLIVWWGCEKREREFM